MSPFCGALVGHCVEADMADSKGTGGVPRVPSDSTEPDQPADPEMLARREAARLAGLENRKATSSLLALDLEEAKLVLRIL